VTDQLSREQAVESFYRDVADGDLQPLWRQVGLLPSTPPISDLPFRWRWRDVRALAERAAELIPIGGGGDRRVLAYSNPGLCGEPYATRTLWAAVQILNPGEAAPAHRHTPAAVRFVLEGQGVWTLVDGDPVVMRPGDLVLTPSWCWHEHHSDGSGPMLWFDGLDLPMSRALDAVFFENGETETVSRAVDTVSASEQLYGAPGLVPDDGPEQLAPPHSPLYVYRWPATDAMLDRLIRVRTGDRHGFAHLRYADPTTGADVLPTLRCTATRVAEDVRTPSSRRSGSSVWVLYDGAARVVVDGVAFELESGDTVAVPSWAPFDIEARVTSTFFSISDAPVLEALRLARTQTMRPQAIVREA
jgi:gentisate 1,2-dioxygenase